MIDRYREFLAAKRCEAKDEGVGIQAGDIHPLLKPHQRDTVPHSPAGRPRNGGSA